MARLYVGNLDPRVRDRELEDEFRAFGVLRSRFQNKGLDGKNLPRGRSQILRVQAVADTSRRRRSGDDVVMVDPLEAKRLAAQQMQEIEAKRRLKRQRRIEAVNGAWAMIGLTAGLVTEAQTGDSIPTQLAGYWSAIASQFWQW